MDLKLIGVRMREIIEANGSGWFSRQEFFQGESGDLFIRHGVKGRLLRVRPGSTANRYINKAIESGEWSKCDLNGVGGFFDVDFEVNILPYE